MALLVHAGFALAMGTWMRYRAPATIAQSPGRSTANDLVFVDLEPEEAAPAAPQEIVREQTPDELPTVEPVPEQVEPSPELAKLEVQPPAPAERVKPERAIPTQPRAKTSAMETNTAGQHEATRRTTSGSARPRTGASLLANPDPHVPPAALAASFHGATGLRVWVGRDGRVNRVELIRTSGRADCDQSARDQVQRAWRFRPATVDGLPVETDLTVSVKFQLD